MHHLQLHARRPTLAKQLKEFIASSKAIMRITATPSATSLTATYRGNELLPKRYGIRLHVGAIRAELCLGHDHYNALHNILLTIRSSNSLSGHIMMRASAKPLPMLEPWCKFKAKASHTLPQQHEIVQQGRHDNININ